MYSDVPVVVVGNKSDLKDQRCVNLDVHSGQVVRLGTNVYRLSSPSQHLVISFTDTGTIFTQHTSIIQPPFQSEYIL